MNASDFDFVLPPELIAPYPAAERDGSALMVLERAAASSPAQRGGRDASPPDSLSRNVLQISKFRDLGEFLPRGSLLVVNETRVFPARLIGQKATGGRVEILLLQRVGGEVEPRSAGGEVEVWDAMARGLGRPSGPAHDIVFRGNLSAQIVHRGERGAVRARLVAPPGRRVADLIEEIGEVPLPPYILAARGEGGLSHGTGSTARPPSGPERAAPPPPSDDRERYQTVYASSPGAVAAPTAGLHFTTELLGRLRAAGHDILSLTLHVGPGTFRPVRVEDIDQHQMDVEHYLIPEATAAAVEDARRTGRAIVAVGTTVVRALEAAARQGDGTVRAGAGATALFLRPGAEFQVVTDLITNFHLPRSTLLMLVAAFAGRERVMAAYAAAIRAGLRFYSYGDAMFIRGTP
jgi:S-adenosylmethionine:tRNA ribosyltransferase-isomerase